LIALTHFDDQPIVAKFSKYTEFGAKFQREIPLLLEMSEILLAVTQVNKLYSKSITNGSRLIELERYVD